jgi:hypothetical protein
MLIHQLRIAALTQDRSAGTAADFTRHALARKERRILDQ